MFIHLEICDYIDKTTTGSALLNNYETVIKLVFIFSY